MRRSELLRALARVPSFERPRADLEQLATPPEAAAELLEAALARGDLEGRSVGDLGAGTGRLAIGAALLGAERVEAWEADPAALATGRAAAAELGVAIDWVLRPVEPPGPAVRTIVMNPPFGAQRARADRPFWEAALGGPAESVYAFALAESRTFIERRRVAHAARLEDRRPIDWTLPATLRHHRKRAVPIAVDLWVLSRRTSP